MIYRYSGLKVASTVHNSYPNTAEISISGQAVPRNGQSAVKRLVYRQPYSTWLLLASSLPSVVLAKCKTSMEDPASYGCAHN